jgi:ubiquinone/menaquinone biosynthesis C-methylase UbiE
MIPHNRKEESRTVFNKIAHRYSRHRLGKNSKSMHGRIRSKIGTFFGQSLLDVGCGDGSFLSTLNDAGLQLAGIDISEKMIQCCRRNLPPAIDLKIGDAENLPWANEYFNTIVCINSFHHYPNPNRALKEMKRVLKKNGRIYIADPQLPGIARIVVNTSLKFLKTGDVRIYSPKAWRKLLVGSGFRDVQLKSINFTSTIIVAGT